MGAKPGLRKDGMKGAEKMAERLANGQFKPINGHYHEPYYQALCQKLCDMKRRCSNPKDPSYALYGGRGISVCDEWSDPKSGHLNFYLWAIESGYKKGLSLDRIDNDGNYSPQNCRWSTPLEQANNRRDCHLLTIGDKTQSISAWARHFGVNVDTALGRFEKGWEIEYVFSKRKFNRCNRPETITSL